MSNNWHIAILFCVESALERSSQERDYADINRGLSVTVPLTAHIKQEKSPQVERHLPSK